VTTIRPNPFPQTPPGGPLQSGASPDAAKLAAQKAFFAMVSGAAQPGAPASAAQTPAAPAQAPVIRSAAATEAPQKIPRPGSLFDIRV
jgi:hypothetical protein